MNTPKQFVDYVLSQNGHVIEHAMIWDHPYPRKDWPEMLSKRWRQEVSVILDGKGIKHQFDGPSERLGEGPDDWAFFMVKNNESKR